MEGDIAFVSPTNTSFNNTTPAEPPQAPLNKTDTKKIIRFEISPSRLRLGSSSRLSIPISTLVLMSSKLKGEEGVGEDHHNQEKVEANFPSEDIRTKRGYSKVVRANNHQTFKGILTNDKTVQSANGEKMISWVAGLCGEKEERSKTVIVDLSEDEVVGGEKSCSEVILEADVNKDEVLKEEDRSVDPFGPRDIDEWTKELRKVEGHGQYHGEAAGEVPVDESNYEAEVSIEGGQRAVHFKDPECEFKSRTPTRELEENGAEGTKSYRRPPSEENAPLGFDVQQDVPPIYRMNKEGVNMMKILIAESPNHMVGVPVDFELEKEYHLMLHELSSLNYETATETFQLFEG